MVVRSPVEYGRRAQSRLRTAFVAEHPPEHTAASFAVGLFLTALPNLGASILALGVLGRRVERANTLAFFAAVAVLNPLAKGTVYVASFVVGAVILGPVPGITRADVGLTAGADVLVRLLVGNLLIAAVLAVVGYVLALYGVHAARRYRD
jgi:uncharacterized protein (DUF2062 family)